MKILWTNITIQTCSKINNTLYFNFTSKYRIYGII